jgi:hypothetical protein
MPVESEAKVTSAGPILGERVAVMESRKKMVGISFAEVFDAEVINGKSESGATRFVSPQTGSKADGSVAVRG